MGVVAGAEARDPLGLGDAELRGVVPVRSEAGRDEGVAEARTVGDPSGARVGGGCQAGLAEGSMKGRMVSGRAGPPAKLTPTITV
ncbi:hypothetical protein GA0070604_3841 [Micromonospora eburnea]|uniref:Uncharacterized protein n=1 Tax=Micromonospora eburnea TaxID=227316 RepID=A0A1C6UWN9_9ACTN|nr:hypothetical protein GA0070604_3841 [Micromonospora eburnea]